MKSIDCEQRYCENCQSQNLESLWHNVYEAKTRNDSYLFDVRNVICPQCGFVFVSPVFAQNSLTEYYTDSFGAFSGQEPEYDVTKRLDFLRKQGVTSGRFVEIGSNRQTIFHDQLRSHFESVLTVELNGSVESDHRSIHSLPDQSADVVAHYFVLEHIPHVKPFLRECARLLKQGGILICEVPDISIYPQDPSALELWEHTNHFSIGLLNQLTAACGLSPLDYSQSSCSRSFGFAAAYRRENIAQAVSKTSEYEKNKVYFLTGLQRLEQKRAAMSKNWDLVDTYQRQGKKMLFWAANAKMRLFVEGRSIPEGVVIVDSNPEKYGTIHEKVVQTPDKASAQIVESEAIFIFAGFHSTAILEQIAALTGKHFSPDHVHIVDYSVLPTTLK